MREKVSDADTAMMRAADFGDPQIIEIIAPRELLLTNFMDNAAKTDSAFPGVEDAQSVARRTPDCFSVGDEAVQEGKKDDLFLQDRRFATRSVAACR
jgi:hypothetical protein